MSKFRCVMCRAMYEKKTSRATRLGLCGRDCEKALEAITTPESISLALEGLRNETPEADPVVRVPRG